MQIQEIIQSIRSIIRLISQPEYTSKNFSYFQFDSGNDKFHGEYVIIVQTTIQNVTKSTLNEMQLKEYLQNHLNNRIFIHPSDPEFSSMIHYFIVNSSNFIQSKINICQNLERLSDKIYANQWITDHGIYQSEDSQNPKAIIHLMNRADTIAFVFQIFDLKKTNSINEAEILAMNEFEADLLKLRQELLRKSDECETLKKELNQVQNHEAILNMQIQKSQQFIAQLEAENQHLKENTSKSLNQITETNNQTAQFQNQISELEKSIRTMKIEMFDFLEGKKKADEAKKQAEESYRQISEENVIIKNKFGELERTISELRAQITQQKDQIQNLEIKLKQEQERFEKTQEEEKNERTSTLKRLHDIQDALKTSIEEVEKGLSNSNPVEEK